MTKELWSGRMEQNRRRRILSIAALVAWSVAGCLVFSSIRWRTALDYFSIKSNATAAVALESRRHQSQIFRQHPKQIGKNKVVEILPPLDNGSHVVFLPVPVDELALRVEGYTSPTRTCVHQGQVGEDSCVVPRISTRGMGRAASWDLFNSLASKGKLDFRGVAKYSLDDYLTTMDQEILADEPVKNLSTIASPDASCLELAEPRQQWKLNVGENVTVRVILKDAEGRPVLKGGHVVRVWMVGKDATKRSAAVDVIDLRNGTYVASLPVLWPGPIEVRAALQRPREFRKAVLSALQNMKMMLQILAAFQSGATEEVTLCSFLPVVPGYQDVCNLTTLNSGLPWFCGRPFTPGLRCRDWTWSSQLFYPQRYQVTEAENALLVPYITKSMCSKRKLPHTILLTAVQGRQRRIPRTDGNTCRPLTPRETWEDQSPRGYWEGAQWRPLSGCPLPKLNQSVVYDCLHDTHFLSLGDSNAREVMKGMQRYTRCAQQAQEGPTRRHMPLTFHCPDQKLLLSWNAHAYPFFSGYRVWSPVRVKRSPGRILDTIPATGKYVIMIHLYMHFAVHHIYIYTQHVRDAARGVRDLLKRNPSVKVFIRGPHALDYNCVSFQSDLHATRTMRVLQREFRDLREQVMFLNVMDMTVANENCDIHPNEHVVRTLCEMIVSHVCPK